MSTDIDEDLEDQAEEHFDQNDSGVICPLSGESVQEFETAYDFPGAPEAVFYKVLAKRDMSAEDYVKILKSGEEGAKFKGFTAKSGKSFDARVRYNSQRVKKDGERSPGCEFVFTQPKTLSVKCPKSGEAVIEHEKSYTFPGYSGLACWKLVAGRKMTAEEYVEILKSGSQEFEGFQSKKTGKKFSAKLAFVAESSRQGQGEGKPAVEFQFDN